MSTVMMTYKGTRFIKHYTIKYLKSLFYAWNKGAIDFTDGNKKIEWGGDVPHVIHEGSWTSRELPSVLIGDITGGVVERTFSKNRLKDESNSDSGTYRYIGADMDFDLALKCRGRTVTEKDDLVDTILIWMSHPDAKEFFEQHDIKLPEPPRLVGSSEVFEPGIDHPLYEAVLSVSMSGGWVEKSELEDRLLDIITDVTLLEDIEVG